MVHLLNEFGRSSGFVSLLKRLSNYESALPIDLLMNFIRGLINMHQTLFRNFALEFVPVFWRYLRCYLSHLSEGNLRQFDKKKIDIILQDMSPLLARAFSMFETQEMVETCALDIIAICIKSNILNQQILGLKLFEEVTTFV